MGFSRDTELSKKRVVVSTDEKTAAVLEEEGRRWQGLNPEILALIFVRIPLVEMVRSVPFVCKPWMEVVAEPYCWRDIDLQDWCRNKDSHAVDLVVKKLIRRSNCTVQRLSTYHLGESGLSSVANCGRCLNVLEIRMSDITDDMVLNHLKPLPNLTLLDISDCSNITAKGIEAFGTHCKSLIHLKRNMLYGERPPSPILDDSEAIAIANTMPNLQRINFYYARFGDLGVSEIFAKCNSLTHLDIQSCWNVELRGDLNEQQITERLKSFTPPWFYGFSSDSEEYMDPWPHSKFSDSEELEESEESEADSG